MRIKNISNKTIVLYDLRRPDNYMGVTLDPGKETIVFDEDAEKSENLSNAVQLGYIQIISEKEPYETEEVDLELSNKITEALDRIKKLEEEEGGVVARNGLSKTGNILDVLTDDITIKINPENKLYAELPTPTFTALTDTPDSYEDQGNKFVRVKLSEDGLEFADIDLSDYVLKSGSITQISSRSHSDLQNLGNDDHSQYLLASGTRSLTGDWNVGGGVSRKFIMVTGAEIYGLPGKSVALHLRSQLVQIGPLESGGIVFARYNVRPVTNDDVSLGDSSFSFKTVYTKEVAFGNSFDLYSYFYGYQLILSANNGLYPYTDNQLTLGSSDKYWKEFYTNYIRLGSDTSRIDFKSPEGFPDSYLSRSELSTYVNDFYLKVRGYNWLSGHCDPDEDEYWITSYFSLYPYTDSQLILGSPDSRWLNIYGFYTYARAICKYPSEDYLRLDAGSYYLDFYNNMVEPHGTVDLGSSFNKFRKIFLEESLSLSSTYKCVGNGSVYSVSPNSTVTIDTITYAGATFYNYYAYRGTGGGAAGTIRVFTRVGGGCAIDNTMAEWGTLGLDFQVVYEGGVFNVKAVANSLPDIRGIYYKKEIVGNNVI